MNRLGLTALFAACAIASAAGPAPQLKRSIPLPDVVGRIDHLACDVQHQRLYVAALGNDSLELIDLGQGERIDTVRDLPEVQGVVFVPRAGQVAVACGQDGTVRAYDATTLKELHKIDVGGDADNMRLSADESTIFVGCASGAVALLDATTLEPKGRIEFAGHPEAMALDPGADRIFINVPGGAAVLVGDRTEQKITDTWTLKVAGGNFPMALDAAHKRLFVGCRRPAKLLVIDTDTGAVLDSPDCVGDADDIFIDAQTGRIIVIGGQGAIDVFETTDHQRYRKVDSTPTAPGARTGLFIPDKRTLYVAVPRGSGHSAEIREYTLPDE